MKLILTGANGAAGSEVLRQALLDPRVTTVTTLTRSPLPAYLFAESPSRSKLTQILHADFAVYPPSILEQLAGHDAVIWALGTSSIGVSEHDYTHTTYDYAIAAAKAFSTLRGVGNDNDSSNPFVFAFLSGARTTQNPTRATTGLFSTPMWARIKGCTEADLARITGIQSYSFRPAFIVPVTPLPPVGVVPSSGGGRYNTRFFRLVGQAIGSVSSHGAVQADVLAKGMIRACLEGRRPSPPDNAQAGEGGSIPGWNGKGGEWGDAGVFENAEITRLGQGLSAR